MESIAALKIDERIAALDHWMTHDCRLPPFSLQPMQGDASFRRYFRVLTKDASYVAMDAPPPRENCQSFVAVARALRMVGLQTPEILQADTERGFLLLTDFGDATYLKTLTSINVNALYGRALDALAVLQSCKQVEGHAILPFTQDFMLKEWDWHKEWFLQKLLGLTLSPPLEKELNTCNALLVESAAAQAQVFMHRDYHSANLMVLANDKVGILDFQDAFIGPVTYDLASLLRDSYIDWKKQDVRRWALSYWERLRECRVPVTCNPDEFLRAFDWMGLQRNMKALLTFARKSVRDRQPQYLAHIPRTLNYLIEVSGEYPAFSSWHDYLQEQVQPAFAAIRNAPCEP